MPVERNIETDNRQLGAMLLIVCGGLLWIMNDEGKVEECAGTIFGDFQRVAEMRKNVPAGGRNGYESVEETLKAEFYEEVGFELPNNTVFELMSSNFFIVDQVKGDLLKRLAVSAWMTRVDSGTELEHMLSQKGEWVRFSQLRQALKTEDQSTKYRPQLLMAAAIASGLLDTESIHAINRQFIAKSNKAAENNNWDVFLGVVDNEGNLNTSDAGVLRFLGKSE